MRYSLSLFTQFKSMYMRWSFFIKICCMIMTSRFSNMSRIKNAHFSDKKWILSLQTFCIDQYAVADVKLSFIYLFSRVYKQKC